MEYKFLHTPSYPCLTKNKLCDCPGTCACPRPCYCERTCSSPCSCPNPCSCPIKRWLKPAESNQDLKYLSKYLKCRTEKDGLLCLTKQGEYLYLSENNKTSPINKPIFARWDITYKCNLLCKHCYSSSNSSKPLGLSISKIFEILDFLDKLGILAIQFLGGEPFIRKDFIEILHYTVRKNFGIYINTNATLMNDNLIKNLQDIQDNILSIQVGLESPQNFYAYFRGKDLYNKVLENLEKLTKIETTISVVTVLTPQNITNLDKFIRTLIDLNIKHLQILTIAPCGRALNDYKLFQLEKKHIDLALNIISKHKSKIAIDAVGLGQPLMDETIKKENNNSNIITSFGCEAGDLAISLNPYGKVSLCSLLGRESYSLDLFNYKDKNINLFLKDLKRLKEHYLSSSNKDCLLCDFYKNKQCKGYCLVH